MMVPHHTIFSRPQVNLRAIRNSNWKNVEWEKKVSSMKTGKKYAIVGTGFVGKKLIHTLLLRGETNIKAFDMDPTSCDVFKNDPRVQFVRGNVCDYEQCRAFVEGADVVYATFAMIRFMDRFDFQVPLSFNVNVVGTENVIKACNAGGVKLLIQTSTSNVAVAADQVSFCMDEKVEYVRRENSPNHYGWTKAIAEQLVLNADRQGGMRTAAVRPCSAVIGAEDRHMVELMLNLGRAFLPPNGGGSVVDFVSVMNVVWGHLLLEKALWERPDDNVAGQAFCVSNNQPMRLFDLLGLVNMMRPGGVTGIPAPDRLLRVIAIGIETLAYFGYRVPGQLGSFTKTTCDYLDLSYVFSSRKAFDRLGYEPIFSVEDALQMAVEEWQMGQMLPALGTEHASRDTVE